MSRNYKYDNLEGIYFLSFEYCLMPNRLHFINEFDTCGNRKNPIRKIDHSKSHQKQNA